jgi:hypothetical protein
MVDTVNEAGLGERMQPEGLLHQGIALRFRGRTLPTIRRVTAGEPYAT